MDDKKTSSKEYEQFIIKWILMGSAKNYMDNEQFSS